MRSFVPTLAFFVLSNISILAQNYSLHGRQINYQYFVNPEIQQQLRESKLKSAQAFSIKDSVQIGVTDSETAHNLTGLNTATGNSNGKNWRNATNGNFTYDLTVDSVQQHELKCIYWGSDAGARAFDIFADGVKLSYQRLNNNSPGKFFSVVYSIPLSITRHKSKVTIRFQSKTDSIAGDVYGCRIQTIADPGKYWPANIHDPSSIIKCGSTYWIFGTGDGIFSLCSNDLISWQAGPTVFAKWGIPSWILTYVPKFEGFYWAPECFYMNGKYYMYYSASQWGTKLSCIGVATNATLDPNDPAYKWVDQGLVVSSNHGSNYNAIDPAVMRDPTTGKIWLTYGSFNVAGIKVTEIDSVTGKIKNISSQTSVCNHWVGPNSGDYIGEAAYMLYHNGYFYLFVNYGGCCAGINSSYYIIVGRSTSPTGPFLDKNGANLYKVGSASGGTVVMQHDNSRGTDDRYYGPGCLGYFAENGTEYVTFHYYDPNFPYPTPHNTGGPMLAIAKLKWDTNDWPVIAFDWIETGRYKINNKNSSLYWDKNSSLLVQATSSSNSSQQFDVYALPTGEYKISNASALTQFIETSGADRNGVLQFNTYTDAIYQKFRVLKSVNNEILVYQSKGLRLIEVPWASYSSGVQLGVWWFNDHNCQKWYATKISEIPNAIQDISTGNFRVYPNPASQKITIDGGSIISERIEILDISGKLVLSENNWEGKEMNLDISSIKEGIYFLRIYSIKETVIIKFIKQ
jgi:arabinan endo-1,5-alpha-L-arabinosidase